jgi:hypothetical protein
LLFVASAAVRWAAPLPRPPTILTPAAAEVLAGGVQQRAATALWWSLCTEWVRADALDPELTLHRLHHIHRLDPTFRAPWIYGGLMLQAQGDGPSAVPVLEAASRHFPDDPWFPAALGVQLQGQGELDDARRWLLEARRR